MKKTKIVSVRLQRVVFSMIAGLLLAGPLRADNLFQQSEKYREALRLQKIEGQNREAKNLAKTLLAQMDSRDELYPQVNKLVHELQSGNPVFPLDKAIQFATGYKDEIFCKEKGLVFLEAHHNDGTTSTVKLLRNNRRMAKDSYSLIVGGDWSSELDTAYREPMTSESWLVVSTPTSFELQEFRVRADGEKDEGVWRSSWKSQDANDYTGSYSTKGETPEPLPMHLATDYSLWGTFDLGFKIRFKVGARDQVSDGQSGSEKRIYLKTERQVLEHLKDFKYTDSNNNPYSYADCFKVRSQIKLDRLENTK